MRVSCAKADVDNSMSLCTDSLTALPMAPDDFAGFLKVAKFTNGSDQAVVVELYAKVFAAKATSTKKLVVIEAGADEMPSFFRALHAFTALQTLILIKNNITDIAPLAEALKTNTALQTLYLTEDKITDIT